MSRIERKTSRRPEDGAHAQRNQAEAPGYDARAVEKLGCIRDHGIRRLTDQGSCVEVDWWTHNVNASEMHGAESVSLVVAHFLNKISGVSVELTTNLRGLDIELCTADFQGYPGLAFLYLMHNLI